MTVLYPLIFKPILKDYIWGGRTLATLGRDIPQDGVVAESWDIAAHQDGTTAVANGHYANMLLTDLQAELGEKLIGTRNSVGADDGKFPLIVKLLDANRPLSVQVHPTDEYALEHEKIEFGKTEMWIILKAEPNAKVVLGIKSGTTAEVFKRRIENGTLEDCLHYLPVKAGDHICVPAGSLHAIMGDLLIAEIQQNSNTTYRVYDWNRAGDDGKSRPLHIDSAMNVINFDQVEPAIFPSVFIDEENGVRKSLLCSSSHFTTERVEMAPSSMYKGCCDGSTFEIWGLLEGNVTVSDELGNDVIITPVLFTLLPAALGNFSIQNMSENATLIRTYVE